METNGLMEPSMLAGDGIEATASSGCSSSRFLNQVWGVTKFGLPFPLLVFIHVHSFHNRVPARC